MRVAISHETVCRYPTAMSYSVQYLRMTPLSGPTQRVLSWKVTAPGSLSAWTDGFGNAAQTLVVEAPHEEVRIQALGEVEIADGGRPLLSDGEPHAPMLYLRPSRLTQPSERVNTFARGFRPAILHNPRRGLDNLMSGIREAVDYQPGPDLPAAPACQALEKEAASGGALAHLFVTCCRGLGVPARYVSGYLCTDSGQATRMTSHAWAEAWIDGAGWLSFDVAHGKSNAHGHIRVAVGLDALDAAPWRGIRHANDTDGVAVEMALGDASQSRRDRPLSAQEQQQQ